MQVISEKDTMIKELMARMQDLTKEPPRFPTGVAEMIELFNKYIPFIYQYIHKDLALLGNRRGIYELIKIMYEFVGTQFFSLIHHIHPMSVNIAMEYESPWSPIMAGWVFLAEIATVADDGLEYMNDFAKIETLIPSKNSLNLRATLLPAVANSGFCISDKPIGQYTAYNMMCALRLISISLRDVDFDNPEWKRYLLALTRRSFCLIAEPHPAVVLDLAEFRETLDDGQYKCNSHFIRRIVEYLSRFMHIVEFYEEYVGEYIVDEEIDPNGKLKAEILKGSKDLIKMGKERMILGAEFEQNVVTIGQRAKFTQIRGTEDPKPQSVIIMTELGSVQQCYSQLVEFMNVPAFMEKVGDMDHFDKDYFVRVTTGEHIVAHLLKMHAVDLIFDMLDERFIEGESRKVSFRGDFVIYESFFFNFKDQMVNSLYPVIFILQNRFHVFYGGHRFPCKTFEYAVWTWAFLFKTEVDGIFHNGSIMSVLDKILDIAPQFDETDYWQNKQVINLD